jgi:hypothetical protein
MFNKNITSRFVYKTSQLLRELHKVLVQSSSRSCLLFSLIGLELSHRTGGVNRELRVAAAASVPVL